MPKTPQAVAKSCDQYVAARLRRARVMKGVTQVELAEAVGVSFQQIQKYEKGVVRVSAGRLMQFCAVLELPVSFFYADLIAKFGGERTKDAVIVDLTGLTSTKASAVKRLVNASDTDAQTIDVLLARLQKSYS